MSNKLFKKCLNYVIITTENLILFFFFVQELYGLSSKKGVVLVLHGASGLPKELVEVRLYIHLCIYISI